MTTNAHSDYLSVREAAAELGVSPSTIWRWIEAGRLPALRIGPKLIRLRKTDVEGAVELANLPHGRAPLPEGFEVTQEFETIEDFKRGLKPMTEEGLRRFDEALRGADEIRVQILKRRGGKLVPSSTDIIREWRDRG